MEWSSLSMSKPSSLTSAPKGRSAVREESAAAGEEVRELGGEGLGRSVGGEGCYGCGAAEGEEDFFAGGLAGLDVFGHVGAGEEAGCAFGGSGLEGGRLAGGAEVYGREAAGAGEGGQEGQDHDVDGWVRADLREGDLGCGWGLAVVDCYVVGGGGVEVAAAAAAT